MAGVSRWLWLEFGQCQVALLAKDGIYIEDFPRWISHVSLPPGGRADVVVRCPGGKDGLEHTVNSHDWPGVWPKSYVGPLFSIRAIQGSRSSRERGPLQPWRPGRRPGYLQDLRGQSADCACKTMLHMRWIDDLLFRGTKYLHQWPRDAVVQRELAGIDRHSFHQHTWPFQLQTTPAGDDPYFKAGDWHDTYQNVFDPKATVRFRTVDFAGPQVVHCHMLTHEDEGMIGSEVVQGWGPENCRCDLLNEDELVSIVGDERSQRLLVASMLFMAISLIPFGMMRQVLCPARYASYKTLPEESMSD
ncbi:mco [Symbiodinium sp. CCMP2592]|nr:mco [Symbiodinium sp. CCMP2592]